jgi:hypothetical protein
VTVLAQCEAAPEADAGLRCLKCDYNLTGLTSQRCPECGWEVEWDAVQEVREQAARQIDTPWARWPWHLKPVGFFVTAVQVAFTPWIFARRVPLRPTLLWPLAFATICFVWAAAGAWFIHNDTDITPSWMICGAACILAQTVLYGLLAPPRYSRYRFRWWLVVCCYASWPLLIEVFSAGPPVIGLDGDGNVWTTDGWFAPSEPSDWATSAAFHVWWLGLVVVAAMCARPKRWWRVLLVLLSIPLLTIGTTYLGVVLYDIL